MKNSLIITTFILSFCISSIIANDSYAAGSDTESPKQVKWSFEGIAGKFNIPSIQRGLQVYREVCASCHGLKRIAYRNLKDIGFNNEEIKQIASEASVLDGPNDEGEMFERSGLPSDRFVDPFLNDKAARSANGGALPPDLSLMVKARVDGANYIYSLLMGYGVAPADFHLAEGKYYNKYFPGNQIAMPPPIDLDSVEYSDGMPATKEQITKDVVNFLHWAAEPEMEERKTLGAAVLIYMFIFTILFYIAKRRVWARVK